MGPIIRLIVQPKQRGIEYKKRGNMRMTGRDTRVKDGRKNTLEEKRICTLTDKDE